MAIPESTIDLPNPGNTQHKERVLTPEKSSGFGKLMSWLAKKILGDPREQLVSPQAVKESSTAELRVEGYPPPQPPQPVSA